MYTFVFLNTEICVKHRRRPCKAVPQEYLYRQLYLYRSLFDTWGPTWDRMSTGLKDWRLCLRPEARYSHVYWKFEVSVIMIYGLWAPCRPDSRDRDWTSECHHDGRQPWCSTIQNEFNDSKTRKCFINPEYTSLCIFVPFAQQNVMSAE